jgi:hypothetical protein
MRTLLFLLLLLFSFALPRELLMATTYPIYYPLLYLAGGLYEVRSLSPQRPISITTSQSPKTLGT